MQYLVLNLTWRQQHASIQSSPGKLSWRPWHNLPFSSILPFLMGEGINIRKKTKNQKQSPKPNNKKKPHKKHHHSHPQNSAFSVVLLVRVWISLATNKNVPLLRGGGLTPAKDWENSGHLESLSAASSSVLNTVAGCLLRTGGIKSRCLWNLVWSFCIWHLKENTSDLCTRQVWTEATRRE